MGLLLLCCCLVSFRQGLTMQPWLTWNLLCRLGWPRTHRDLLASASQELKLKACASMPGCVSGFKACGG